MDAGVAPRVSPRHRAAAAAVAARRGPPLPLLPRTRSQKVPHGPPCGLARRRRPPSRLHPLGGWWAAFLEARRRPTHRARHHPHACRHPPPRNCPLQPEVKFSAAAVAAGRSPAAVSAWSRHTLPSHPDFHASLLWSAGACRRPDGCGRRAGTKNKHTPPPFHRHSGSGGKATGQPAACAIAHTVKHVVSHVSW